MTDQTVTSPAPTSTVSAAPAGLFARQSSGLVREIGLKDALAMNLIIVAPAGVYVFMAAALGVFPRTELIFPIFAAGVVSLFLGLIYGQLTAAMPRSGGDYVFMSRIVHPAIGALVGGGFLVAFFLSVAFGALFFAQVTFPFFLTAWGSALHIHAFTTFATTIATHTGSFLVSMAAVVAATGITMAGSRAATRTVFYGFLLTLLAIVLFVVYLFATSRSGFIHAFNHASGSANAYQAVQHAAHANGLPARTSFGDMWLTTPYFILAYVGFTFAVYPGGEIKKASTTVLRAVLGALMLAILVCLLMWLALRVATGLGFIRSADFLSTANAGAYGKLSSVVPQGQDLWLLISKDPVSKLLAGLGFGVAAPVQVVAYLFITARLIFAMSFDRMLPTRLADVSERTHTPLYAILASALLSVPFVYLGSYTTTLATIFRNEILIFLIVFWLTSAGAILLPYRRRDLYDASPKVLGARWFGLPAVSVAGAISFTLLSILIGMTVTHSQINGGFTGVSVTTLAVTFALGPAIYVISRLYSRRSGIDLNLAMTELPPE
jgi:APA family basic amino acid/polyamine antiporter